MSEQKINPDNGARLPSAAQNIAATVAGACRTGTYLQPIPVAPVTVVIVNGPIAPQALRGLPK